MTSSHMHAPAAGRLRHDGLPAPPPGAILAIVMPCDSGVARAAAASDRRAVTAVTPSGNGCPP